MRLEDMVAEKLDAQLMAQWEHSFVEFFMNKKLTVPNADANKLGPVAKKQMPVQTKAKTK